MIEVTSENFKKEVLESNIPVFVDMYAPWCGPCKAIAPILEKLQAEYGEKIKIVKVDIDENSELATKYNIQSIPNMVMFKDGKEFERIIGVAAVDKFRSLFDKVI